MSDTSRRFATLLLVLVTAGALAGAWGCGGGGPESPTAPLASAAGNGNGGGTGDGGGSGGGGGGGGGGSTPPPPPPPTPGPDEGTLAIRMTDAPIDDVSVITVFIAELKVKRAGEPVERFAATVGPVDLLALQGGVTALLGQEQVAAGTYQFIELLLDEDLSSVVETESGAELPLKIPSEKIKIAGGPFEVLPDGTTSVLVDFDAEKSLKRTGKGRYQLKPFVTIAQVTEIPG